VTSFEEQDTKLKLSLADVYEADQDYVQSARTLATLNLDSTQRNVTDTDKARVWVRVARCYLEEDDPTSASASINRAKNVMHNVKEKEIRLQFAISQARILDSQRAFLDASAAYYNMSSESMVDEDDRLQALSAAITCAVLAPAGPPRARMLGRLYKDDRASQTDEYSILSSIYLNQILSTAEISAFAAKLQPHQLAKTSDGSTVLDRAVLEHNLLGVSRLYRNIRTSNLGALLGVDSERAQQYAAQMIEQGRLAGSIDQIDGVIYFDGILAGTTDRGAAPIPDGQSQTAVQQHVKSGGELRLWDAAVQGLAEEVEKVSTMIQTSFPEFYAQHMAY
jgi:COP9 signalosome complex subunit 4